MRKIASNILLSIALLLITLLIIELILPLSKSGFEAVVFLKLRDAEQNQLGLCN